MPLAKRVREVTSDAAGLEGVVGVIRGRQNIRTIDR